MKPFAPVSAVAMPFAMPNLDTDQLFPARFLSRPRGDGYGDCLFKDLRSHADGAPVPDFILNHPAYHAAEIIVGERNFGCGSSREHAVWALVDYGFRVAVAPSFGDIFYANGLKNGLLPVVLPAEIVSNLLGMLAGNVQATVAVDLAEQRVVLPDGTAHYFDIDSFSKHCLLQGIDELDFTLSQADRISAFENQLENENS